MEHSEDGKTNAGELPRVCLHIMLAARPLLSETYDQKLNELRCDSVMDLLSPYLDSQIVMLVLNSKSLEPDILSISLELPLVTYFLHSDAPVLNGYTSYQAC